MNNNALSTTLIELATMIYKAGGVSEEESIRTAFAKIKAMPEYADNRTFYTNDITYIQGRLARIFRVDYWDFDAMVFYNDNLESVLNCA